MKDDPRVWETSEGGASLVDDGKRRTKVAQGTLRAKGLSAVWNGYPPSDIGEMEANLIVQVLLALRVSRSGRHPSAEETGRACVVDSHHSAHHLGFYLSGERTKQVVLPTVEERQKSLPGSVSRLKELVRFRKLVGG